MVCVIHTPAGYTIAPAGCVGGRRLAGLQAICLIAIVPRLMAFACGALVVAAVTGLVYPLQAIDPGVSSGVLYVAGVLLVATYWGLVPGLVTSLASALALDYFHTDPTGGLFYGKDGGDLFAISVMTSTAVFAAVIASRARLRARDAAERARLGGVQASRARVLTAADDERRRVVRDLHDGAQQRLVHTVITLKLARRALLRGDDALPLVDEALQYAHEANAELRELAHGILPAVLTRGGLRAGVDALAARSPVPVAIDVDADVGRMPAAIEATAYFFVAELLTNVAKHAQATRVEVTASISDRRLRLSVRDDGVGGARPTGPGLLGIEDRLGAHDGTLLVVSPPGGGTRVSATLPLQ
jgi:signal transduction histidine kinase